MLAVIDHKDSFTHNLVHMLKEIDEIKVIEHTEAGNIDISRLDALVFSPGPGGPNDYPESISLYKRAKGNLPILGVCLGFQMILYSEGARIVRQPKVLHGVQTPIIFDNKSLSYRDLKSPLDVGRYHSLQVEPNSVPDHISITAWDQSKKVPLSVECPSLKIYGFQYHPDSFLSDHGQKILTNCLSGRMGS
ncbi:MAG: aminodeoxychorismate/anthranilate synthase component II [Opitutae bacterium]|nr:aminodeoxychorismate/anthranilate synthase component II [Opitutae bacterium]